MKVTIVGAGNMGRGRPTVSTDGSLRAGSRVLAAR
jgi:hypothetical protein